MPTRQQLLHIIQGCITANRLHQKEFYKLYYGYAMSISMRYCHAEEEAADIVNDSFLKIFKTLISFSPRYENYEASLMGWMKSIIIHTSIDYYRKGLKAHLLQEIQEDHFEITDSSETTIDSLSYKEIFTLIQKLSGGYRIVFNMFVIDGFKHEEIARQLNISVGTSKSNLAKARVNIQKMLKVENPKIYEERRAI
ncbi:MAG: sigma-70 family RNA polymerase sigma factor [Ferruginibacter sp.]